MAFKIQVVDTALVGVPWRTVRTFANQATAERVAQHMKCDGECTRVIETRYVPLVGGAAATLRNRVR